MKPLMIAVPAALLIAACSSSNSRYIAATEQGDNGYYESPLSKDRYRVVYKSYGDNLEQAKDFALLRAAELTLQLGHDWFEIVDRNSQVTGGEHNHAEANLRLHATTYRECGILACRTVTAPTYIDNAYRDRTVQERETVATIIEIVMGEGEKPEGGNFYDAQSLAETIRARS